MRKRKPGEKLTPAQVLEMITERGPITIEKLSRLLSSQCRFEVTVSMVKNRLKQLRTEGEPLISGGSGYSVMRRIESDEDWLGFKKFSAWLLGMATGAAVAHPALKATLKRSMPYIREQYSLGEVKAAKQTHLQIARIYEAIEVEKELEE